MSRESWLGSSISTMGRGPRAIVCFGIVWIAFASLGCSRSARYTGTPDLETRVAALADECYRRHPDAPALTVEVFLARSENSDWNIVDVRSASERSVSVIPGAQGMEEFEARRGKDPDRPVLVYCTAGCRSGTYTVELLGQGIEAYNLSGGVLAWALSGGEFVTQDGVRTRRVHVFGRKWNALPPDYEGQW